MVIAVAKQIWDAAKKALKHHTLLEGEALAGWTESIEKKKADLTATTRKNFHHWNSHP